MKKRKTLGLIINDIDGNYHRFLWLSFKKAADEMDCNLLVFEGRSLGYTDIVENQHHIVYSFIEKGKLDGLIITSPTISSNITYDEFLKFCGRFKDVPTVSLSVKIPDAISLIADNKEGMKELIKHLIDEHNYKRIIFVTGPKDNVEAIGRFEAYKDVLSEKKIRFDEELVFYGDFIANTGYRIMEEIFNSNVEYDAIVFANDDMALGAIKCIENKKEAGRCPIDKKFIMCGYDDSLNASKVNPPLTTVRQPLKEMCHKAVELLANGENGERVIVFPSAMVRRESCGCSYKGENKQNEDNTATLSANFRAHENIQTYSIDELFDKLTPILDKSHIKSCFVFKYIEGPVFYDAKMIFDESFKVPSTSEMIYSYYDRERKIIDDSNRVVKTTQILPECFLSDEDRYAYLVLPLFFRKEHFGYICFEVTDNKDVMTFELLRGQISNTLKGAFMLMEREQIEENLRENERMASLGQMIGGISHNLMTPIMSISCLSSALQDLSNEYLESIGDESVTTEDHYEISSEIGEWIKKLKKHNAYMSNVISTVKGQTVQLNANSNKNFNIDELVNRIMFLKNSNITIKKSNFKMFVDADSSIVISGDISNIIQVLDNLIKNAIQSYCDKELNECKVELSIWKEENMIMISVKDFGRGIPDEVKSRIFKFIVTTKGENGNGLSLFLSYSTIKGKFRGEIWFRSKENEGTEFTIALPIGKNQ